MSGIDLYVKVENNNIIIDEKLLRSDMAAMCGCVIKIESVTDLKKNGLLEVDFLGHSIFKFPKFNYTFPLLAWNRFCKSLAYEKHMESV